MTSPKAVAPTKEWTILYHQGGAMKGRGEFLRLMLEDKGVDYDYWGDHLYGPTGMMDCFRGSAEAVQDDSKAAVRPPFPVFFPPAIWHRPASREEEEVCINQAAAAMMYIGEKLGYAPDTAAEMGRATSILLNAHDYIADGRRSFHPVKDSMSYKDQKEEGDKCSLEWTQQRMPVWLAHFEKVVGVKGATNPVAGGSKVTYADFALFHVLDATIAQFNNEKYNMAWDKQAIPKLKEYHQWMKSRPKLKVYLESDRCGSYAGDSMM